MHKGILEKYKWLRRDVHARHRKIIGPLGMESPDNMNAVYKM